MIALTIDAENPSRPCRPGVAEEILGVLLRTNVRATFFVQGQWATAHPSLVKRMVSDGHLVGSHGFAHVDYRRLSDVGIVDEIGQGLEALTEAGGPDPRPWFRLPYGGGDNDDRVLDALRAVGMRHVGWHVLSADTTGISADDITARVLDALEPARATDLVLMHSWPSNTPRALYDIITAVGASRFAGVDEL